MYYVCVWVYVYIHMHIHILSSFRASLVVVVKNPPGNAGDIGSILGWERSPGGGNGKPLQYSCLKNPMDTEAWQATIHGVAKSWTWLSTHTCILRSLKKKKFKFLMINVIMYMNLLYHLSWENHGWILNKCGPFMSGMISLKMWVMYVFRIHFGETLELKRSAVVSQGNQQKGLRERSVWRLSCKDTPQEPGPEGKQQHGWASDMRTGSQMMGCGF